MNKFLLTGEIFNCCGCRACEQICPVHCIEIAKDQEGFLIPTITNRDKCIGCGACSRVCPIENPEEGNMPNAIYASASADKETRKQSSSGGMFFLLAKKIVDEGGVVVGAELNLKERSLHHALADTHEGIYPLLGSKYIASDTNDTFSRVKRLLSQKRRVLYVGTPCQIAGLRKYIKSDTPYLYTCDLLCHGVPSQYVFEQYIEYLEKKHKGIIVNWNFRDKEKYGWSITLRYDVNHKGKIKTFYTQAGLSPYFYGFLRGKFLRESCYHCPYTKLQRVGDITLADFWGVKALGLSGDVSSGCSCVLVNTLKGMDLFNSVSDGLQFKHQVQYEQAYRQNVNFLEPCKRPQERDVAIKSIKSHSFQYVASKYCKNPRRTRMKIKEFLIKLGLYKQI